MSAIVLTDCLVKIGATDFSGQTTSAAIAYKADGVDITAMGDGTKKNAGGLKEWSMSFELNGDEAVTGALFALVGTQLVVEVRPTSAARSATNPGYTGTALVTDYTPLDGSVGDKHKVSLSVVSAGVLTRAIV